MSAPSRSTSHVSPPHGWRRRSRTTSPRSSSSDGLVWHRARGYQRARDRRVPGSEPRRRARREVPVGRRDADRSETATVDLESGNRAASWAIDAAGAASASPSASPARRWRSMSNGSPSGTPSTMTAPAGTGHHDAGHDPDVADRDRLGAGVAQLVDELLDRVAVDRPVDRDDRRPARRPAVEPDQARTRSRSALDLVDRHVAARRRPRRAASSWLLERRDLLAQLVVAGREVGDEHGQVLRRQLGEARSAACERSWTTTRSPSRNSDHARSRCRRDRPAHQGAAEAAQRARGLRRRRRSRRGRSAG